MADSLCIDSMKYHLVSVSSDICEDDYEEGEGASTGCGLGALQVGRTFDTFQQMLQYLASYFGLPNDEPGYHVEGNTLHTSKTVADHSNAQNGGWFDPTEAELKDWKEGKIKLYSENFLIKFLRCL